jgi:hypothetical protein
VGFMFEYFHLSLFRYSVFTLCHCFFYVFLVVLCKVFVESYEFIFLYKVVYFLYYFLL